MWSNDQPDRRATGSRPLRAGALRCTSCGTTWFDQLAAHLQGFRRPCRRCGGDLHTERRQAATAARVMRAA